MKSRKKVNLRKLIIIVIIIMLIKDFCTYKIRDEDLEYTYIEHLKNIKVCEDIKILEDSKVVSFMMQLYLSAQGQLLSFLN